MAACASVFFFLAAAAAAVPSKTPAVVTSASYLSAESDVIDSAGWVRTLYGARLDEDETQGARKCVAEDKVFHRPTRACYLLFSRGPCARYEWIVFDEESASGGNLTAVCARRKCAPGWGFDAPGRKCFRHSDCPAPLVFHYSLFGDGVCRCNGSSGPLRGDPQACYPLYRNAPCPKGQMVAPRYRLFEGLDAVCFRDPCDGYSPPEGPSSPAPVTTSAPTVTERPVHDHHAHSHHQHTNTPSSSGAGFNGFTKFQPNLGSRPFSQEETVSTGDFSQSAFDFEVEVMPVPNRHVLDIKTSTRAVVASNNNNNNPPPRNVAAPGNNAPPTNGARRHGPEAAHHHGLPPFKITLTPFRLADVTSQLRGGRKRRGVSRTEFDPRPARGARGAAGPRVEGGSPDLGDKVPRSAAPAWEVSGNRGATSVGASGHTTRGVGGTVMTDDYSLQVQYTDGTLSCMSPSQLNVICDLVMVPLFSDFSELKVPICVNMLFRFAIGRVGKSEECVPNDNGDCAAQVVVKSPDPLDWEIE